MNRKTAKAASALVCLLLLCTALFSAAASSTSTQINAEITLQGAFPAAPENYTVRLTANDSKHPMPDGSTGSTYDIVIAGAGKASFPPISFKRVGVYSYDVTQLAGTNPQCTYDKRHYTVIVTVSNAAKGGYEVTMAVHENGQTAKPDSVAFENVYTVPAKPTTPPGSITSTGVNDDWILYFAGSGALLLIAIIMIRFLLRKEDAE